MKVGVVIMSDLRSRLNKILDLHGKALSEAVGQREPNSQEAQLPIKDLVLKFADSDPTDGKSRTQWLVKTYIADEQFKLEDLGRVDAALAAFERFKRKLPVEKRELSRLKSLRDLEALVNPLIKAEERARLTRDLSSATGREKRRLEELKARDESVLIQEGDGLPTIAVPMTEFASKWWGRGTQWCTAAENNNAFNEYHKEAPLVIIVCPDGAKFQMNVTKNNVQFMDNTDKTVSQETIGARWDEFQSLFYWAVGQNGYALTHIPEKYRNLELCLLAVERHGIVLEFVPKNKRTLKLCSLAVKQDGQALQFVPENKRTPEIYSLAVEQDGLILKLVPKEHRTPELYRLAVAQNGLALEYVSEDDRTPELCQSAVEQNGLALLYAPNDLKSSRWGEQRTPELCRIAVEQNGMALRRVPGEHKTLELCRTAVEQCGEALSCVPTKYKEELCRTAVEQDGLAIIDVPEKYQTPELYRLAVEQNGLALQFVPPVHRTPDLCRIHRTPDLCRIAVKQYGEALRYVPKDLRTLELCRIAVEQNGWALKHVPEDTQTLELCFLAVEQNRSALQFVPEDYKTPDFLALIPPIQPVQPKWDVDILKGLGYQSSHERIVYPGKSGLTHV
jgi:Domain of unknown function (DUF4116)